MYIYIIIIIIIIIISSSSIIIIVYKPFTCCQIYQRFLYCIPKSLEQSGATAKEATFAPMVSVEHFETRPNLGDFGGPPLSSLSSWVEANVALHLVK
jgi:hypothetical protein